MASHVAEAGLLFIVVQGMAYLSYPLIGWFTDVYLTRHSALKWSLTFITMFGVVFFLSMSGVTAAAFLSQVADDGPALMASVTVCAISFCTLIASFGPFDANAIQFGLDQMLEASTDKLIAFIQWYYWCHEVGHLVLFYVTIGLMAYASQCIVMWTQFAEAMRATGVYILFLIVLSLPGLIIALSLFVCSKSHFYIQRAGLNPYKIVYNVLKYAKNHTFPENRSAFTYWEEDIPSRVDLGKSKYGGPFTTEEVEDTKTFLRILPLLLALFGFHLAGDGYSATEQFLRTSCPSLPVLLLVAINPKHLSSLVVLIGVPVYRFILVNNCRWCHVRMVRRMWLGLVLSLAQVLIYTIIGAVVPTDGSPPGHRILTHSSPSGNCYYLYSNATCSSIPYMVDNTYLWFIIPQLLNGLSSLLVSMTALEFICAQAPRTTQGMLIGLWYATFSIRYLVVYVLDPHVTKRRSWLIYQGVRGALILVSLALYSCVSKHYRYRQRDEIVNIQAAIEDIYERILDQEEEYEQEQQQERALLEGLDITYGTFTT